MSAVRLLKKLAATVRAKLGENTEGSAASSGAIARCTRAPHRPQEDMFGTSRRYARYQRFAELLEEELLILNCGGESRRVARRARVARRVRRWGDAEFLTECFDDARHRSRARLLRYPPMKSRARRLKYQGIISRRALKQQRGILRANSLTVGFLTAVSRCLRSLTARTSRPLARLLPKYLDSEALLLLPDDELIERFSRRSNGCIPLSPLRPRVLRVSRVRPVFSPPRARLLVAPALDRHVSASITSSIRALVNGTLTSRTVAR